MKLHANVFLFLFFIHSFLYSLSFKRRWWWTSGLDFHSFIQKTSSSSRLCGWLLPIVFHEKKTKNKKTQERNRITFQRGWAPLIIFIILLRYERFRNKFDQTNKRRKIFKIRNTTNKIGTIHRQYNKRNCLATGNTYRIGFFFFYLVCGWERERVKVLLYRCNQKRNTNQKRDILSYVVCIWHLIY